MKNPGNFLATGLTDSGRYVDGAVDCCRVGVSGFCEAEREFAWDASGEGA